MTGGGWNGVLRGRCGGGIPVVSKGRFVGCCVLSVSKGGEGGRRKRSFVVVKATASTASTEVQSESNSSATGEAFGLNRLLDHGKSRRFVFVSGKGGVGKTTSSASIAVKLAGAMAQNLSQEIKTAHATPQNVRGCSLSFAETTKLECGFSSSFFLSRVDCVHFSVNVDDGLLWNMISLVHR